MVVFPNSRVFFFYILILGPFFNNFFLLSLSSNLTCISQWYVLCCCCCWVCCLFVGVTVKLLPLFHRVSRLISLCSSLGPRQLADKILTISSWHPMTKKINSTNTLSFISSTSGNTLMTILSFCFFLSLFSVQTNSRWL